MNMRRVLNIKHSFIVAVSAALIGSSLTAQAAPATDFKVAGAQFKTLSVAAATATDKTVTRGTASPDKKTLTFSQKIVRIVAHSGPANDMLSYRIDGLRNPTIVVPAGTTIKVLYINTDDDMTHNLRFGAQHIASAPSVGTPNLAHRGEGVFYAADVTLRVPKKPGTYYYFCTIPGHAPGGMWGAIRVR
jgi:rusticyanin